MTFFDVVDRKIGHMWSPYWIFWKRLTHDFGQKLLKITLTFWLKKEKENGDFWSVYFLRICEEKFKSCPRSRCCS